MFGHGLEPSLRFPGRRRAEHTMFGHLSSATGHSRSDSIAFRTARVRSFLRAVWGWLSLGGFAEAPTPSRSLGGSAEAPTPSRSCKSFMPYSDHWMCRTDGFRPLPRCLSERISQQTRVHRMIGDRQMSSRASKTLVAVITASLSAVSLSGSVRTHRIALNVEGHSSVGDVSAIRASPIPKEQTRAFFTDELITGSAALYLPQGSVAPLDWQDRIQITIRGDMDMETTATITELIHPKKEPAPGNMRWRPLEVFLVGTLRFESGPLPPGKYTIKATLAGIQNADGVQANAESSPKPIVVLIGNENLDARLIRLRADEERLRTTRDASLSDYRKIIDELISLEPGNWLHYERLADKSLNRVELSEVRDLYAQASALFEQFVSDISGRRPHRIDNFLRKKARKFASFHRVYEEVMSSQSDGPMSLKLVQDLKGEFFVPVKTSELPAVK